MIVINYRDPRPIHVQITEAFRRLILSGSIASDERLPSVRDLAAELAINPNTIQRAYRELEAEGFIYTVQGRGSFATPRAQLRDDHDEEFRREFVKAATALQHLGYGREDFLALLEKEVLNHD